MPRLRAQEARGRFAGARVARLATVAPDGAPHLVPIVFAVLAGPAGDRIVSAVDHKPKSTRSLRRLANIAAQPRVSLLVDEYDDDWSRLWWARADGVASVYDAPPHAEPPHAELVEAPRAPHAEPPHAELVEAPRAPHAELVEAPRAPYAPPHAELVEALQRKYADYRVLAPAGPFLIVEVSRWSGWSAT